MLANPQAAAADASVAALLERVAAERPQATFLIDPQSDRTMSFAELRGHAEATSLRLRGLGLRPGAHVCVAMDNGPAAVTACLGALRGGFVPVPLDPGSEREYLAYVVRHCAARALLVGAERQAQVESIGHQLAVPVAHVDVAGPPSGDLAAARGAPSAADPDDDALLMYTSGTTGRPKGVLVSQAGLVARLVNCARAHELGGGDRLLCVLPLYHMSALIIMLAVLASGGSMVLPTRFRVTRYWDWVLDHGCTWLGVVPTIIAQLLQWGESRSGPPPEALRRVRFARCSSAPLSERAHRAFEERFGIVLMQGMGMTEAGGIFLNPPHRARRKIGSLGRSCGLEVKVVDRLGCALGPGQTGELLVRGPGVMRGYYKDAEASASAFDAAGWLRTGDLAYRDEDGYFFHAGRVKDLIIKAGTNVAPREVDEALASHPDVAQAVAVGVPDPHLGEDIGAFVLLRAGAQCNERALLDHCEAHLGEFKTPSWIRFVEALPTGPTGKVRRALLAQRSAGAERGLDAASPPVAEEGFVAPRTAAERAVAEVWAQVLGCQRVGVHDNFFALGGTSLLALRVTTRLRQTLGVQLSLGALLAAPSVAVQAALVEARQGAPAPAAAPAHDGGGDVPGTSATLLAPVDERRTGVPLFCVHDIARFRPLAQMLGPGQPVYGVAVGPAIAAMDGTEPVSSFARHSIEELARVCLPEIRRIQPVGPYRVAGFSFGGRIALEVAQQLRAAGEEVQLLVIFDTFMPGTFRPRPLHRLRLHLEELLRAGPAYIPAAARRRWGRGRTEVAEATAETENATAAVDRRYAEFRHQLRDRYRPRPFPGRVVLFRATANQVAPHYRVDPQLGWGRIACGELRLHDVPGAHLEILDERGASIVAAALRAYLGA